MIVGFLRSKNNPPKLARLLSHTCQYHDLTLIYMTPEGISMDKNTVKGKMLISNVWENVEVPLPKYIDVNPHLFSYKKYSEIMAYLQEKTKLSITRRNVIKKDVLQKELCNHSELNKYGIPSKNIKSFNELLNFIYDNKRVVVKPVDGLQGKSVIVIKILDDENFVIGEQKEEKKYTKDELHKFYELELQKSNYLMQKYIESRTKMGDPFDCRIHMEKGAQNKWNIANMFIRIGIGQSIVSNVSQGGGISKVPSFLEANFGTNAKQIEEELKKMAIKMAVEIEKITDSQLATMGLDVGIDLEGQLHVFEINSFPIVSPQMAEITLIRPQYYKYMVKQGSKKRQEINKKNRNSHLDSLNKENSKLKREIEELKNSTSWKITRPVRGVGKILKKIRN